MSAKEKQICRLCFDIVENEFKEMDKIMCEMFDVLLLEMDINVIGNPIICQKCAAVVERSFYFKSICVHTEKLIVSFAISREQDKFELNDIFLSNKNVKMSVEDFSICRFCMIQLKSSNFVPMEILMKEAQYEEMLPVFMPEMDFSIVVHPMICTHCKENLKGYFKLVRNCLNVENKINTFCQNIGIYSMDQLRSTNVAHFLWNDNLRWMHIRESTTSGELENVYPHELMKTEEVLDTKHDEILFNENSCKPLLEIPLANRVKDTVKHKVALEVITYNCSRCSYETKYKQSLTKHMSTHKDTSKVEMYKCTLCTYETKQKYHLKRHMPIHGDASEAEMHKCLICSYQGKCKSDLKLHLLTHKSASEVELYNCAMCNYETKRKHCLKKHILTHKDASEVEIYKCSLCSYETKHKRYMKRHMLTHKDTSEVKMYKCSLCSYEAKRKDYIKPHMLTHKDASEVKIYNCSLCSYETKNKRRMKIHMLIHKDASEIKLYNCALCSYETNRKNSIKRHMLTHTDDLEVKIYKCSLCSYKAKRKDYIKQHMLTHKDASEVEVYNCSECNYQAKRKGGLKRHLLTHKRP